MQLLAEVDKARKACDIQRLQFPVFRALLFQEDEHFRGLQQLQQDLEFFATAITNPTKGARFCVCRPDVMSCQ